MQSQQAMQQTGENGFQATFLTGYTNAEGRQKKVSYQFIGRVLKGKTEKRSLDEVFDCSVERWTQLIIFMDASVARALSSYCLWPVAMLERTRNYKTSNK